MLHTSFVLEPYDLSHIKMFDLRHEQDDPPPKALVRAGKVVKRGPETVTGIVVHQTAVEYGVTRSAIRRSSGNELLAKARRSLNVACHAMAFTDGMVAVPNDLDVYVHHANRLNATTLGLEIEGLYPGLIDNPKTVWQGADPTELTALTIQAACAGLKYLATMGRAMGMPIQYIYAHRQSSVNRRNDPGEGIWKSVVLDYAVKQLGLFTRVSYTIDEGYSIPKAWDPSSSGSY